MLLKTPSSWPSAATETRAYLFCSADHNLRKQTRGKFDTEIQGGPGQVLHIQCTCMRLRQLDASVHLHIWIKFSCGHIRIITSRTPDVRRWPRHLCSAGRGRYRAQNLCQRYIPASSKATCRISDCLEPFTADTVLTRAAAEPGPTAVLAPGQ